MLMNSWKFIFLMIMDLIWIKDVGSCKENGYTLTAPEILHGNYITCSSRNEDISTLDKLINLISQDNIIGIYKINKTVALLCYWNLQGNGMVDYTSLTGGELHLFGKNKNPSEEFELTANSLGTHTETQGGVILRALS